MFNLLIGTCAQILLQAPISQLNRNQYALFTFEENLSHNSNYVVIGPSTNGLNTVPQTLACTLTHVVPRKSSTMKLLNYSGEDLLDDYGHFGLSHVPNRIFITFCSTCFWWKLAPAPFEYRPGCTALPPPKHKMALECLRPSGKQEQTPVQLYKAPSLRKSCCFAFEPRSALHTFIG